MLTNKEPSFIPVFKPTEKKRPCATIPIIKRTPSIFLVLYEYFISGNSDATNITITALIKTLKSKYKSKQSIPLKRLKKE